jgi:tRNA(fMet)-specific endonuclease VapC
LKPCLLDTDILSLFFRNHPQVVHSCNLYLQEYRQLSFSLITHYEILSGLKHRDAQKQLDKFLEFSRLNQILLLTEESVTTSAKIYADLRKKGTPLDDIDLLIAGVAIANNLGSSLLFMLNQQTRCQDNILLTQKFRKFLKP